MLLDPAVLQACRERSITIRAVEISNASYAAMSRNVTQSGASDVIRPTQADFLELALQSGIMYDENPPRPQPRHLTQTPVHPNIPRHLVFNRTLPELPATALQPLFAAHPGSLVYVLTPCYEGILSWPARIVNSLVVRWLMLGYGWRWAVGGLLRPPGRAWVRRRLPDGGRTVPRMSHDPARKTALFWVRGSMEIVMQRLNWVEEFCTFRLSLGEG